MNTDHRRISCYVIIWDVLLQSLITSYNKTRTIIQTYYHAYSFLKKTPYFPLLPNSNLVLKTCSHSYISFICKFSKNALINGLSDRNIKSPVRTSSILVRTVFNSFFLFHQWIIHNHSPPGHYLVNVVPLKFHQKSHWLPYSFQECTVI